MLVRYEKRVDSNIKEDNSFPRTRWTLIAKTRGGQSSGRNRAVDELCTIYWRPVFAFILSRGANHEEAEDLTQGFFAGFISSENFAKAREEQGKLRTFILKGVRNFMIDDWRRRTRLKRGGGKLEFSLDKAMEDGDAKFIQPSDGVTPETVFERQWALTVLSQVLNELADRYEKKGQAKLFEKLRFVISTDEKTTSYAEICDEFGMSEGAVKVAAFRLKNRYAELLREKIADTLVEGESVEDEIAHLKSVFAS